jgi:hypothetical protein
MADRCAHLHSVRKSHAGHVFAVSMARRTSAAYSNPLCGSGWLVHRLLAVCVRDISALRVSNEDDTRLDRAETLPAAPALVLSTTQFVGIGSYSASPDAGEESADSSEASATSLVAPTKVIASPLRSTRIREPTLDPVSDTGCCLELHLPTDQHRIVSLDTDGYDCRCDNVPRRETDHPRQLFLCSDRREPRRRTYDIPAGCVCPRKVGRMPLTSRFHQESAQARRPFGNLLEGVHTSLSYPKAVTMLLAPEHSAVC